MLEAFTSLRNTLSNFCILNVPLSSDQFLLHTDASGLGVGCVLNVCRDGEILPAAFYSCQLRGAEVRYSAMELEALAVLESIKHFLHYLNGRKFTVITDHKPLTSLITSKTLNGRLHGIALKLMEHDMVIEYRQGAESQNGGGLSRQALRYTETTTLVDPRTEKDAVVNPPKINVQNKVPRTTDKIKQMPEKGSARATKTKRQKKKKKKRKERCR